MSALIFSQWSRKKYAVFCSLKRVIEIATLSVDTSEGFIKKCNNGRRLLRLTTFHSNENAYSPDYWFLESRFLPFSIFLLISFTLLPETDYQCLTFIIIFSSLLIILHVSQIPINPPTRKVHLNPFIASIFFLSEKFKSISRIARHCFILKFKHIYLSSFSAICGCYQDYIYRKSENQLIFM